MKRSRIKPVSARRLADADQRALTRQAVFDRDGRCRLAGSTYGPCIGPLTPHHLRKEGQGGEYVMSNLLTLCAGHNDRIESLPRADMVASGLVVPGRYYQAAAIRQAWSLLQLADIVGHWWDGTPAHRPRPDDLARYG